MQIRNAKYLLDGRINCEVEHSTYGWTPYTASVDGGEDSQEIFARITSGEVGEIAPANLVAPLTPEQELQAFRVGLSASNLQARLALNDAGMLTAVEQTIALADKKTQIAWDRAQYFRRLSPLVLGMQTALGWTDEQMDSLFTAASQIEA